MIYKHNGSIITDIGGKWLSHTQVDPYNPLGLPPYTVRVRTSDGNPPSRNGGDATWESATLVTGTSDIYDVFKTGPSLDSMFQGSNNVVEILGANTSNVTSMYGMFYQCGNLTTITLFDTSKVTNMAYMFRTCSRLTSVPLYDTSSVTSMIYTFSDCLSLTTVPLLDTSKVTSMYSMLGMTSTKANLTTIPLFNTSSVTDVEYMCSNCTKVQSGALALYNQMSTQTNPPTKHGFCFQDCGKNTSSGAAELAQIPSDWTGRQSSPWGW